MSRTRPLSPKPAPQPQRWQEPGRPWVLREFDLFQDLTESEMQAIADAAPMQELPRGRVLFSPHKPVEVLFILKKGRVRLYRTAADGRSLTTNLIEAGQIFGEMASLGQTMDDTWAETLDPSVVCLMSRHDVQRLLLSDARIAARLAEHLGRRTAELERRLHDAVLRPAPARIASALASMAGEPGGGRPSTPIPGGRGDSHDPSRARPPKAVAIRLTHEQLADLVGATRETVTRVLGELRDRGALTLRRGRIIVHDPVRLRMLADDETALADVRTR